MLFRSVSYTAGESKPVRRWLALFIILTVLVLLTIFFMIGTGLLNFFGITIAAFRIAGGILLLLTGIKMVYGEQTKQMHEINANTNISAFKSAELVFGKILIPLAIPLFVGPGSISTVILYSTQAHDNVTYLGFMGVLWVIAIVVFISLLVADKDRKSTRLNSSHITPSRMPSSA